MQRKPASRTGGITVRHRYDHVGSPWKKITGAPSPSSTCASRNPSCSRKWAAKGNSGRSSNSSSGVLIASLMSWRSCRDALGLRDAPALVRLVDLGQRVLEPVPAVDLDDL